MSISHSYFELPLLKNYSCGELNKRHISQTVNLAGWVHRRRDHGGLVFIDLRDRGGMVQVVFDPAASAETHRVANAMRNEYVVSVVGEVARRPAGTENPKMVTGELEVLARSAKILNTSKTPPFYINEPVEVDEALRLKYRYLDLRRDRMRDNILLRYRVTKFMRDFLDARGFIEIETPILIKSTPEGARDYLVPSRLYPGKFYALPQSPQQLKQLLMVAGFEKYFQIARCFRDEDQRADRQPEFTQLDIEMSFVDEEDILKLMEEMFTAMIREIKPEMKVISPFPRLTYAEAITRYGTDKPDLRFGLEIRDLSDVVAQSDFTIFRSAVSEGGRVMGICAPGCAHYSGRQLEELTQLVRAYGAKGLVTMALVGEVAENPKGLNIENVRSVAARFLTSVQVSEIAKRLKATAGDLLLIVAGEPVVAARALSELRSELGNRLGLTDPNTLVFAFIVDFPLLEWNKETARWQPMHHPFTAPREEDMSLLDTAPERVRSRHYDLVCNGYELSSGSIRIHTRQLQEKIFRLLGYRAEEIEDRFGHLLEAFEYGAPPHGGIAPGIDRLVMLLAREKTIREVIPFPKTQGAIDMLTNAPADVAEEQLKELHLRISED